MAATPLSGDAVMTTVQVLCYSTEEVKQEKASLAFLMSLGFFHSAGFFLSTMCFISMAILMKSSRLLRSPIFFLLLIAIMSGAASTLMAVISHQHNLLNDPKMIKEVWSTKMMTISLALLGLVPILADTTMIFRIMLFYPREDPRLFRQGLLVITVPVLFKLARLGLQTISRIQALQLWKARDMTPPFAWNVCWILNAVDPAFCTIFICCKLHRMSLRARGNKSKKGPSRIYKYLRTALWTSAAAAIPPIAFAVTMAVLLFSNQGSTAVRLYVAHLYGWSIIIAACFSSFWPEIQASHAKKGEATAPRFVIGFDNDLHRDVHDPVTRLPPGTSRSPNDGSFDSDAKERQGGERNGLSALDFHDGVQTMGLQSYGRHDRLQTLGVTSGVDLKQAHTWASPTPETTSAVYSRRPVNLTAELTSAVRPSDSPSIDTSPGKREPLSLARSRQSVLAHPLDSPSTYSRASIEQELTTDQPLQEQRPQSSSSESSAYQQRLPLTGNPRDSSTPSLASTTEGWGCARPVTALEGYEEIEHTEELDPGETPPSRSVSPSPVRTRDLALVTKQQQQQQQRIARPTLLRQYSDGVTVSSSMPKSPALVRSASQHVPHLRQASQSSTGSAWSKSGTFAPGTTVAIARRKPSLRFQEPPSSSSCADGGEQQERLQEGADQRDSCYVLAPAHASTDGGTADSSTTGHGRTASAASEPAMAAGIGMGAPPVMPPRRRAASPQGHQQPRSHSQQHQQQQQQQVHQQRQERWQQQQQQQLRSGSASPSALSLAPLPATFSSHAPRSAPAAPASSAGASMSGFASQQQQYRQQLRQEHYGQHAHAQGHGHAHAHGPSRGLLSSPGANPSSTSTSTSTSASTPTSTSSAEHGSGSGSASSSRSGTRAGFGFGLAQGQGQGHGQGQTRRPLSIGSARSLSAGAGGGASAGGRSTAGVAAGGRGAGRGASPVPVDLGNIGVFTETCVRVE